MSSDNVPSSNPGSHPHAHQPQRLRLRDGEERTPLSTTSNQQAQRSTEPAVLVLRGLRSEAQVQRDSQHVSWDGKVRENKKQRVSKKCCVFHKKRNFGESDSDSSDGSESGDDDPLKNLGDANNDDDNGGSGGAAGAASSGGDGAAMRSADQSGSSTTTEDQTEHHEHGDDCEHHHHHKKHKPKCTKESCYCGTRFS